MTELQLCRHTEPSRTYAELPFWPDIVLRQNHRSQVVGVRVTNSVRKRLKLFKTRELKDKKIRRSLCEVLTEKVKVFIRFPSTQVQGLTVYCTADRITDFLLKECFFI